MILYMRIGFERGLNKITNKGKRERKLKLSGAIELRGYRDFILDQLQKTIRLQLSLFTNYRNSYI